MNGELAICDADLAMDLSEKNRKDDAKRILEKADKMMDQGNFAYGMTGRGNQHNAVSLRFLYACYMAGDTVLADKVAKSVKTDLTQQIRYYNSLTGLNAENMSEEKRMTENYIKNLEQIQGAYNPRIQIPGKLMAPTDSAAGDSSKK